MKLYCIGSHTNNATLRLLKKSCTKRGIQFVKINPQYYSFLSKINLTSNDLLYRVEASNKARIIEKLLINKKVATFYRSVEEMISTSNIISPLIHYKRNISIPKTVFDLTSEKKKLNKYVKFLGGFPIIIKSLGGSHGVGIMKIDSYSSLYSAVDYLLGQKNKTFIMREFIDIPSSARLIVLGNKVIDSIEYSAPKHDFRSNVGEEPNVKAKRFPVNIQKLAIKATNLLGLELGGVDILIDKKKKCYVAEVNFPCFFPRCQNLTGTDISGMVLDYLIKKSRRFQNN